MTSSPRVTVDTSVVINFLTGDAEGQPIRFQHSAWVFEAADLGVHQLVIPAIVLAEVAGAGRVSGHDVSKRERHERMGAVMQWLAGGRFIVADVDERVARRAAELSFQHPLKGPDACVVAVAELTGCSALYSWDADHTKRDGSIGGLSIVNPRQQPLQQDLLPGTT